MEPVLLILYFTVLAGIGNSFWMLRACSRGPPRLLKRQLYHQASATLIINSWKAALMTWPFLLGLPSDCVGDLEGPLTEVSRQCLHGLFFASWLVDLHIAASVAAAALHVPWLLALLKRWFPLVWLLAALYGVEAVLVAKWNSRGDVHEHDIIGAYIVALLFVLTIIFYSAAVIGSRRSFSPTVVHRRMRARAMVYPLIFIITVFPTVLRYLDVPHFKTCSRLGTLSSFSEHSTATINAIAFCMLSGIPQDSSLRRLSLSPFASPKAGAAAEEVELGPEPRKDRLSMSDRSPRAAARGSKCAETDKSYRLSLSGIASRGVGVVGFETALDIQEVEIGGSWRRGGQWEKRSGSLDMEVSTAQRESLPQAAASARSQEEEVDLWSDYVGSELY